jgi:hypothetical protein
MVKNIQEQETFDWILKLKNDLVRVNRSIKKEEVRVNLGIQNLKRLTKEREDIIDSLLDEAIDDQGNLI